MSVDGKDPREVLLFQASGPARNRTWTYGFGGHCKSL
jgi:hypothetical protein